MVGKRDETSLGELGSSLSLPPRRLARQADIELFCPLMGWPTSQGCCSGAQFFVLGPKTQKEGRI